MGKNWHAPKKTNTRAWNRIAKGDVFWETPKLFVHKETIERELERRKYFNFKEI